MIDYLSDIKPLQDQGVDNATIAKHISDKTASPISNSDARAELQESGSVIIDPGNPTIRSGTLISFYETLPPGETATLVAWFVGATLGTSDDIGTNEYPRSIQFATVESVLPSDLQKVAAAMVADAGGRPDAGTTEADVVAIQAAYEAEKAAEEATSDQVEKYNGLFNLYVAPLIAAKDPSDAKWQTAMDSIASDWGK